MATRGTRATATGLFLTMIAVAAGVSSGGSFTLLLSFAGMLAGATFIFVGVRMADDDPAAPIGLPEVLAVGVHVRAVISCLRRNLGLVGLLLASVAAATATVAAADMEAAPVVCFCVFVLLLLGLSLLNIGVLLREQEH